MSSLSSSPPTRLASLEIGFKAAGWNPRSEDRSLENELSAFFTQIGLDWKTIKSNTKSKELRYIPIYLMEILATIPQSLEDNKNWFLVGLATSVLTSEKSSGFRVRNDYELDEIYRRYLSLAEVSPDDIDSISNHFVSIKVGTEYMAGRKMVDGIYERLIYIAKQADRERPLKSQWGFDLFISYASSDGALVTELKDDLERQGLKCFMAEKDIRVASEWQDTVREALRVSKQILILLTPRSLNRPWVLMETGAAWALGKPLIPALVQVSPSDLIDPIRRYQARVIETSSQRNTLVKELANDEPSLGVP